MTSTSDSQAGAAVYSSPVLKLYDWWVLGISNRWAWRCPTRSVLLPFYRRHVTKRHLDVGVGTGFYPARARLQPGDALTLMDLNKNSLQAAAQRVSHLQARQFAHDVMQTPSPLEGERFDSIALFHLLHCLPGNLQQKGRAFECIKPLVAPGGVVFGATILGDSAGHNGFGRKLMRIYNAKGIFGNSRDTLADLRHVLEEHFHQVEVSLHGVVACFTARQPV